MKKTSVSLSQIIRMLILAIVFVSLTCLLFLGFREDSALALPNQKLYYPLGISLLLSGLVTLLLSVQMGDSPSEPVKWWFYPLMAGLLGLVCMMLAYMYLGVWPIGDRCVMIVDMYHQYAPLLAHLRNMLLHGGNFLYSFQVGLGGSFLPLFAYYLASPFNFLLTLFPSSMLTEGILVVTLLKNALCAYFFALCMQYVFRRRDISVVITSIMYSMMMYLIAYSWNIMWLDCIMVLPLIVMSFERLMRTGKYLPYVLSLAYALYTNYYIGAMVCIFMVLYFLCYSMRQVRTADSRLRSFGRFAIGSLLGGCLVMFLLVPVYISLSLTSAAHGTLPDIKANFDMFNLLGRQLYGTSPTIRSGNLPNVYCGLLAVFLLPIYATLKSIPLRRRIAYLSLFGFMAISLVINQLDLLWHGLHAPNDLPYRFSFLYCFALLLIAYEALTHLQEIRFKQVAGSFVCILAYLMIEERFGSDDYGFTTIYVSLLLVVAYAVVTALVSRRRIEVRPAYCLLLLIVTAEMTFNGGASFKALNSKEYFTARKDYVDNDTTRCVQAAVTKTEQIGDAAANGDFYRMEFLPRRTTVDTAMFGYRGITVFASSNSQSLTKFMGYLGYANNGVNSHLYESFVPATDCLFGIKYVILNSNLGSHPQLTKLDQITSGSSTYYIYQNNTALPLGFLVNSGIKTWSPVKYNPIVNQNSLYTAMTGNSADLYTNASLDVSAQNQDIGSVNGATAFAVNAQGGQKTASFEATVAETGQAYVYVDCGAADSISVSGNGNSWSSKPSEPYIIDAGQMNAGDKVTVSITAKSNCTGNIYVSTLNSDVFESNLNQLKASPLKVTSFSDTHVSGTIAAAKSGTVFTTIPYDKGWTVKVDGKKVETSAAGDAFLSFDVAAGDHAVEMSFFTVGLVPGVVISLIGVAALVALLLFIKKKVNPDDPSDDEFAAFARLLEAHPGGPAAAGNTGAGSSGGDPQDTPSAGNGAETEAKAETGIETNADTETKTETGNLKEAQDSDHDTDAGL